jgi:phospholipid/cholesterol/gamma-HCH transport system permease protein
MSQSSLDQRWRLSFDGGTALVTLNGDWLGDEAVVPPDRVAGLLDRRVVTSVTFDSRELGRWDSSLLLFLAALRHSSARQDIAFEQSGFPESARKLLALLPAGNVEADAIPEHQRLVVRVGQWCLNRGSQFGAETALLGSLMLRIVPAMRGRTQMRGVDLLAGMQDAGIRALPVVALVNVLVGGIIAFMGSVQLRKFGADIYVADLVGIAIVREMGPLMTAVVMCGRTGGAYAAEIATMKGSDEIDALKAIGIPLDDYLVLPRVTSLTGMMPLLYFYGSAVGIIGGFAVALLILPVSASIFFDEMRANVTAGEIVFGFTKSLVFGFYIALVSCRIGLAAGRSSADVGRAATTATVTGIVGVIVIDSIFAVCANAVNF